MPDAVLKSRNRRQWLWWAVGLVGLAGAAAASYWLFLIVKQQSSQHGAAAPFLAVGGFIAAVMQVFLAWLQLRQIIRSKSVEQLAPHERRERDARDRLREHLGRQKRLRHMDDPATDALALRVHPTIGLPRSAKSTAAAAIHVTRGQATGGRRLLPRPSGARPLDRDLPTFVDRDKGPEICDWLREARDNGGFLVLVGDSSVGKTRLLYEAARGVVGDFAVLAPDLGDGDLVNKIAEAAFPLPRLIVWLDELQRFLDGPYLTPGSTPITAATVRRLLDAPTPVIIAGTLWPAYARQLRDTEPDPATGQQRPRYPSALDILDNRRLHCVPLYTFSAAETQAATQLASQDPRLAEAIADRDYGVTEVLAGASALMRRYEQATEEQRAVLNAAIDARRVGIQAPLREDLLREAAHGYMSTVHPGDTWFRQAIDELTHHDRATAPLIPVPNADHRQGRAVTVADYLLQHLTRRRRTVRLPAVTWQALIDHRHRPDDLLRLGRSAHDRLLYSYAESMYRRLADVGDRLGPYWLGKLRADQGRISEAIEVLRVLADAGDEWAGIQLTELLADQGRAAEAIEVLRVLADAGGRFAESFRLRLALRLAEQGRADEAIDELGVRVPAADKYAGAGADGGRLADLRDELLAQQGRADELRVRAAAGDSYAAKRLADLLADQGRADELRVRAAAGDSDAAKRLADLLADQGRADELRIRAAAGDRDAAKRLADLLAEPDRVNKAIEALRVAAAAGDRDAAKRLADLLADQGRADELRVRADGGDEYAAKRLAYLLAEPDRVNKEIDRARAEMDSGEEFAASWLAYLLAEQGRTDEAIEVLRVRADAGSEQLAELLAEQGRTDEAIEVLRVCADGDDQDAAGQLAELLAERGRTDELRAEVDAGTPAAAARLITVLAEQGETTSAARMRRFGLNPDGSIADENSGSQ